MLDHLTVKAAKMMREKMPVSSEIGLILGSGLGDLADEMERAKRMSYSELPGIPVSTVAGHAGRFVSGNLSGRRVLVMQGRLHYYEGYSMQKVTFPIRVLSQLGVKKLIITNAAGGINPSFRPGDLMVMTDHINNMGNQPFMEANDDRFDVRFSRTLNAYSEELIHMAEKVADELAIDIQKGVYVANSGPTYETPAEVRMLRKLGGDAVGMSTVPEVIAARQANIEVLGISCITNMAAGMTSQPLSHQEVIETAEKVKLRFSSFVKALLQHL